MQLLAFDGWSRAKPAGLVDARLLTEGHHFTALLQRISISLPCPCYHPQVKLQLVGFNAILLVEGRELLLTKYTL